MITVRSAALGRRADITVFKPDNLPPDAPVVTLLHGVYGSHWSWALQGEAHLTAARMIQEGALPPLILVMPSDGLWGDGSGYVARDDQDVERWIVDEAPAAAAVIAPEISERSPRFIAGVSMGGYGALRLAARHPGRYVGASALSAITALEQMRHYTTDAWVDTDWASEDLVSMFAAAGSSLPAIHLECGRDDGQLEDCRMLHERLNRRQISHSYEEYDGGHDWRCWRERLAKTMANFASQISCLSI